MFCSACGEKVVETAVICPKCGSPVGKKKLDGEVSNALIISGFLGALFFPVVGVIIGIVLVVKGKTGLGISQIVLSIILAIIWASALTSAS